MSRLSVLIFTVLVISIPCLGQNENPKVNPLIAPGAKLEKLSGGFLFTEGPIADSKGNIYFTDQPNDKIHIWSTDGKLTTFLEPSGRANGQYFDKKGNLWACAEAKNELWSISPDKQVTKIPLKFEGNIFNSPNDLWITKENGVYFTDPFWRRTFWDHSEQPQKKESLYYLHPDHSTLTRVDGELVKPNGLIGSADGRVLYVADMGARKTYKYNIQKDGSLTDKTLFCELGSDGMTIDSKGNIYLTGRGVIIFDKMGKQVGTIDIPEAPTNVCFGGKDFKTLFVTARTGIYSIKMNVKGAR
jgi:gluconolactonase